MRIKPRLFLNHWRAKLMSLVVATVLWLVLKHGIAYTPSRPLPVAPPQAPNILLPPRA